MTDAPDPDSAADAAPSDDWFATAWAAAKLRAGGTLRRLLAERRGQPVPADAVEQAHARLADAAAGGDPTVGGLLAAAGIDAGDLTGSEPHALVEFVAASFEEPDGASPAGDEVGVSAGVECPEWTMIVAWLAMKGAGTDASPDGVVDAIAEVSDRSDRDDAALASALAAVLPAWQTAGVVDDARRLTELGAWLLPRAACRAWDTDFDDPDAHAPRTAVPRGWVRLVDDELDAPDDEPGDADDEPGEAGHVLRLRDGRSAHLPSLVQGTVATHRLTEEEVEAGALAVDVDLAHFIWVETTDFAVRGGGYAGVRKRRDGRLSFDTGLVGPAGWLGSAAPGDLVAVRVADGMLSAEVVVEEELDDAVGDATAARLGETFDALGGANPLGGPLDVPELVLELVGRDPSTLARPQPPLSELLARAGLELDDLAVRRPAVGAPASAGSATQPAEGDLDDDAFAAAAYGLDRPGLRARQALLAAVDTVADEGVDALGDARLAELAGLLADERLAEAVGDAALDSGRDAAALDGLAAAVEPHTRRRAAAAVRYVRGRCAEQAGHTADAEAHLHAALSADARFGPALVEAAWYAEDRGEAQRAVTWLRRAGVGADDPQLARLRAWAAPPPASGDVGRNAPCPCGSGRKFKKCCAGRDDRSLEQRAGWLLAKAHEYADRPRQRGRVMPIVEARAGDASDHDRLVAALRDPLVFDLALFDAGLLEAFVDERGELLPADERDLARQWLGTAREVYDVVDVRADGGVTLAPARGGAHVEVTQPLGDEGLAAGGTVFARVVPAPATHLLTGGTVPVAPEQRAALSALLDDAPDARAQAAAVAGLEGVREPVTVDGEPMVLGRADYELADAGVEAARRTLDAHYVRVAGDVWVERGAVGGQRWTQAVVTVVGSRLTVEANSEARLQRVRAALEDALPHARWSTRPGARRGWLTSAAEPPGEDSMDQPTAATPPEAQAGPERGEARTFRLRIDLDGTSPPVWRRVEVASDLCLDQVHDVVQAVVGWTDSHLHRFADEPELSEPTARATCARSTSPRATTAPPRSGCGWRRCWARSATGSPTSTTTATTGSTPCGSRRCCRARAASRGRRAPTGGARPRRRTVAASTATS